MASARAPKAMRSRSAPGSAPGAGDADPVPSKPLVHRTASVSRRWPDPLAVFEFIVALWLWVMYPYCPFDSGLVATYKAPNMGRWICFVDRGDTSKTRLPPLQKSFCLGKGSWPTLSGGSALTIILLEPQVSRVWHLAEFHCGNWGAFLG